MNTHTFVTQTPARRAHCRYAFATLNLLIDALLLSPVVLLVRSVLLPVLAARLLRAPLAEAERALLVPNVPDGGGIELTDRSGTARVARGRASNGACVPATGDTEAGVELASAYGCDDGSAGASVNPMRLACV